MLFQKFHWSTEPITPIASKVIYTKFSITPVVIIVWSKYQLDSNSKLSKKYILFKPVEKHCDTQNKNVKNKFW